MSRRRQADQDAAPGVAHNPSPSLKHCSAALLPAPSPGAPAPCVLLPRAAARAASPAGAAAGGGGLRQAKRLARLSQSPPAAIGDATGASAHPHSAAAGAVNVPLDRAAMVPAPAAAPAAAAAVAVPQSLSSLPWVPSQQTHAGAATGGVAKTAQKKQRWDEAKRQQQQQQQQHNQQQEQQMQESPPKAAAEPTVCAYSESLLRQVRAEDIGVPWGLNQGCSRCHYRGCAACLRVFARWRPEEARRPLVSGEAPIVYATEEELRQPLQLIASLRPVVEEYGGVCIRPPPGWGPPDRTEDHLRRQLVSWGMPTRIQEINRLQVRHIPPQSPLPTAPPESLRPNPPSDMSRQPLQQAAGIVAPSARGTSLIQRPHQLALAPLLPQQTASEPGYASSQPVVESLTEAVAQHQPVAARPPAALPAATSAAAATGPSSSSLPFGFEPGSPHTLAQFTEYARSFQRLYFRGSKVHRGPLAAPSLVEASEEEDSSISSSDDGESGAAGTYGGSSGMSQRSSSSGSSSRSSADELSECEGTDVESGEENFKGKEKGGSADSNSADSEEMDEQVEGGRLRRSRRRRKKRKKWQQGGDHPLGPSQGGGAMEVQQRQKRSERQRASGFHSGGGLHGHDDGDDNGKARPSGAGVSAGRHLTRRRRRLQQQAQETSKADRVLEWRDVEGEYWRIVENPSERLEVLYVADVDVSSFPRCESPMARTAAAAAEASAETAAAAWHLEDVSRSSESVLCLEDGDISGILSPWLYFGMVFSSFCWHVEDHYLYSLNRLHWGAPKVWYCVPGNAARRLEACARRRLPHLFALQPDLMQKLITQVSPSALQEDGVAVYRMVQQPGDFVVTMPRAYHCGFSTGLNCAEAVNVAPLDWLPFGLMAVNNYRRLSTPRRPNVSHDKLLLRAADRLACAVHQSCCSERELDVRSRGPGQSPQNQNRAAASTDSLRFLDTVVTALKERIALECRRIARLNSAGPNLFLSQQQRQPQRSMGLVEENVGQGKARASSTLGSSSWHQRINQRGEEREEDTVATEAPADAPFCGEGRESLQECATCSYDLFLSLALSCRADGPGCVRNTDAEASANEPVAVTSAASTCSSASSTGASTKQAATVIAQGSHQRDPRQRIQRPSVVGYCLACAVDKLPGSSNPGHQSTAAGGQGHSSVLHITQRFSEDQLRKLQCALGGDCASFGAWVGTRISRRLWTKDSVQRAFGTS